MLPGCVLQTHPFHVSDHVGVLDRQPTTGVPEVDECDSPRSVTRRKIHVAHNLDRFGPRGA
jgi:hypothetical protein